MCKIFREATWREFWGVGEVEREREREKEGRRRRKQVNKTDRVYLLACGQWFYFTDGTTVHRAGGLFLIIVSKPKGQQFILWF